MFEIKKLLAKMVEHDASDLYLTVDIAPAYRVNGVVRPVTAKKLSPDEAKEIAYSVMSEQQRIEFEKSNEQNLALYYPELGRFRVNIFQQRGCIGLVIRQIKTKIATIDDLELPPILKDISMGKRGLVLVVGATGSGKSTTLAAMVDHRNANQPGHIITVEDPIEFIHEHKKSIVTQREVGVDTDSYHSALKNALRQAPDVVLIGEIRDTETMDAAVTFAETGHLCLATIHSNNANQAMERILNFFPAERHAQIYMQLSMNIKGVISQRLIKNASTARTAAVEILLPSPYVQDLIHKGKISELKDAMEKGHTHGMQTFDEHLYKLYKAGKISYEEALKNADSENNLRLKIKLDSDPKMQEENEGLALQR